MLYSSELQVFLELSICMRTLRVFLAFANINLLSTQAAQLRLVGPLKFKFLL